MPGPDPNSKANREFVSEAEEILEALRSGASALSEALESGQEADPEVVNALFRSAHSLKALAGMFHFEPVQELGHRLEDVLDALRLGRVELSPSLIVLLEDCTDLFGELLSRVAAGEEVEQGAAAVASLTARIESAMQAPSESGDPIGRLDLAAGVLESLTEYEEHRLRENVRRGRHIALVTMSYPLTAFEEGLSELTTRLRDVGEVLSTLPAPGDSPAAEIRFSLLVATEAPVDTLAERLALPDGALHIARRGNAQEPRSAAAPATPAPSELPAAAEERVGDDTRAHDDAAAPSPAPSTDRASLKSISDTVRVDIRKLDELMNLVGELGIHRGQLADLLARVRTLRDAGKFAEDFSKLQRGLERKLQELQAAVLEVRMVPLRQVFEKVSRVVRQLRRDLGKEVELEIHGADTELDKLIVEGLVDPLMHVVRNSIDHGIESPDERRAASKPACGRIRIDAFQRGHHVVIEVSDDGRGIDAVALRRRAEERGLVDRETSLSERETLELIFAPGLSTRDEVSETSGRGVGMDVVRSNLGALGGVFEVSSRPGRGTKIAMTLPITLAIVRSLVVTACRQRFAIPLNSVLETLAIDETTILRSEGRELLNLRGEALLLMRLGEEFQLGEPSKLGRSYVIVLGMGDQRIGLLVDRLDGQQDTVIKAIQGPVESVRGIAGATELGQAEPVLVLDVAALIEDAGRRREAA